MSGWGGEEERKKVNVKGREEAEEIKIDEQ